ncbi:helix-turn-helix domain-containing protein [Mycobacteroides franklinii]|uniref:helix-turn-helix domain-containing protein n=1 Tax=Mycobacteroides franklinii TaxID=948102 RepID=UPI00099469E5|nr:helix-turn-helix domain-containing protein [Mycobacteroides franklinii]
MGAPSQTRGAERAQERAVLKAAYEAGASIRALAAAHGHSYGYVHDALSETGTQLRGRGGTNRRRPIPPDMPAVRQHKQCRNSN